MRNGAVIWITGLSGVGKSSVAAGLVHRLRIEGQHPILLDGDELRFILDAQDELDAQNRRRLAWVYARLCALLSRQGHLVICATISLLHEIHAWNRASLDDYVEVLLDVPFNELRRRDPKLLYANGRDIVGNDLPAEYPIAPDLRIDNYGSVSAESTVDQVFDFCTRKGMWKP